MPRPARVVLPGLSHHITQRGNYRQQVFYRDEDYRLYITLLAEFTRHYGVSVEASCRLPNHVQRVAVPHHEKAFARAFQRLHSEYA